LEENEWEIHLTDFLIIGHAEMDDEHRQFIARVNELNRAVVGAEDKATVRRAMDLMLSEAGRHFVHEEALLAARNYPETAAHAARHASLALKFRQTIEEFDQAELSYVWAMKALRFKQLLVEHLMHDDMKYRDFLRTDGAAAGTPQAGDI
jgi:hemerythrin